MDLDGIARRTYNERRIDSDHRSHGYLNGFPGEMFEARARNFQLIGIERKSNELVVTSTVCLGCSLSRGFEAREGDHCTTDDGSGAIYDMPKHGTVNGLCMTR